MLLYLDEKSESVLMRGSGRPPLKGVALMLGLRRWFAFIAAGLAMIGVSREASAKTVMTPYGQADDSCVHETPMGGSIDVQTGDVTVNGAVVDHFAPCSVSWQLQAPQKDGTAVPSSSGGTVLPASGGWYAWSNAPAVSVGGAVRPFDQLGAQWVVPTDPSPPNGDTPLEYFFSSLQNNQGNSNSGMGGCGSNNNVIIIQPVLQWGSNGANGGAYWTMASWEVWGCNSDCRTGCSSAHSPYEQVYEGDKIIGTMWQYTGNLDSWEIYTDDSTTGVYTYNTIYSIPNSWPKFEAAQGGVNENYGITCNDLSADDTVYFEEEGAFEAYPSWNSYYEVDYYGANLLSWGHWTNGISPSCSWGTSVTSTYTQLSWN
jgi:hypothetical protein